MSKKYECGIDREVEKVSAKLDAALAVETDAAVIEYVREQLSHMIFKLRNQANATQAAIAIDVHLTPVDGEHDRLHVQKEHISAELAGQEAVIVERYLKLTQPEKVK